MNKQVTISDLAMLIEAREETRAELNELAVRAYDHCREFEACIQELERRFEHSFEQLARLRLALADDDGRDEER